MSKEKSKRHGIEDGSTSQWSSSSSPFASDSFPRELLCNIMSTISCTRTRNAMSLVSCNWYSCERTTRRHLAVRANFTDLPYLPHSFKSVESLDFSTCSPWGCSLSLAHPHQPTAIPLLLSAIFPNVKKLTMYVREHMDSSILSTTWPLLQEVKLIRWHGKLTAEADLHLLPFLHTCNGLQVLDLSQFNCWPEDVTKELTSGPPAASSCIRVLNLDLVSGSAFKGSEVVEITRSCKNLEELRITCVFDPRMDDHVGDGTLMAIGLHCPKLRCLHLIDAADSQFRGEASPFQNERGPGGEGGGEEMFQESPMADITTAGLRGMLRKLPDLEELSLLPAQHPVPNAALRGIDEICLLCKNMESLSLGSVSWTVELPSQCPKMESLTLKYCESLQIHSNSLKSLAKLCLVGCKSVGEEQLAAIVESLKHSLTEVTVTGCPLLPTLAVVRTLEPLRSLLEALKIDCDWGISPPDFPSPSTDVSEVTSWRCLTSLTLFAPLGVSLSPIFSLGLGNCPEIVEIGIEVEGECDEVARPRELAFGLVQMDRFPKLFSLKLDLSKVTGSALTCKPGFFDFTLWERFYLFGIQELPFLAVLDYCPPHDVHLDRRSLSLPAVGLITGCRALRRLTFHGRAHEHFLKMFLNCEQLRDLHCWGDYFLAPDEEVSVEKQVATFRRFKVGLDLKGFPD